MKVKVINLERKSTSGKISKKYRLDVPTEYCKADIPQECSIEWKLDQIENAIKITRRNNLIIYKEERNRSTKGHAFMLK